MTVPTEVVWSAIAGLATAVGFMFRRYDAAQSERVKEYREEVIPAVNKLADAFQTLADQVKRVLDIVESGRQ